MGNETKTLVLKAAKTAVLPLGIGARRRRGDVVMLLYHRIGAGGRQIDLPVAALDRQLDYLSDRDHVMSLDEAIWSPNGGGVVVTFDDGYRDFHERVLPRLVRYRTPAILYLATGLVEGEAHAPSGHALSWSQLREAVSTGLVTIGAHTHGHTNLATVGHRQAEAEMRTSKELIEDRLGVPCRHFAFPWCKASREAERVAKEIFDTAALDAWRTNRRGRVDPHRLGRTPVLRSEGLALFRAKVAGMLNIEGLMYRAMGRGPWKRGLEKPSAEALRVPEASSTTHGTRRLYRTSRTTRDRE